jgi:hypothetical protein
MWLLKCLKPDHNTISNFRIDNPQAIKKVFRTTVQIARHFDLIGGKLIAGDSTKLRAQNSKKNNYNQAKIDRHVAYIDNKLEEYTRALAENDGDNWQQIEDEIKKQQDRKDNYKNLEKQLKESEESQISISDPESRQIMLRNNITEIAYNVQTTVDSKNNLPIDYKVTNQNDSKAMGDMVRRAKSILRTNEFTVLYDRTTFTEYYERNRKNFEEKERLYKRRQAIVEHPYGTLKRQWGFNYILTKKGISRASSYVGLMLVAYNLRRIVNILTIDCLKEYLRILFSMFLDLFWINSCQFGEKRSLNLS